MDNLDLVERLGVSLAVGLLIGIERGWASRDDKEGERAAGMRTLALTGLLGGVIGAVSKELPEGAILLGLGFAAYSAVIAFFRYREMAHDGTFGATTIVAAMLAFLLGALAVVGDPGIAASAGVAATLLLALKTALHGWIRKLTWEELRAGLMLLAMTLILLPLLPNRGMGPFQALNPYDLWLMTILIAAVSFVGYVAMKWVGGSHGIILSGIAGGLASSTAVTLSYSRLAAQYPKRLNALVAGALFAAVTMMLRILVVAGSLNAALLGWLLLPIGFAALATLALAAWHLAGSRGESLTEPLDLKNPFELTTALQFTLFLAVIMVAAKALTAWAGNLGAYALGAASGIADVDAITLSMSRLTSHGLDLETGALTILVAAASNTIAKAGLAFAAGGQGPGWRLLAAAAVAIASGALGYHFSLVLNAAEGNALSLPGIG